MTRKDLNRPHSLIFSPWRASPWSILVSRLQTTSDRLCRHCLPRLIHILNWGFQTHTRSLKVVSLLERTRCPCHNRWGGNACFSREETSLWRLYLDAEKIPFHAALNSYTEYSAQSQQLYVSGVAYIAFLAWSCHFLDQNPGKVHSKYKRPHSCLLKTESTGSNYGKSESENNTSRFGACSRKCSAFSVMLMWCPLLPEWP